MFPFFKQRQRRNLLQQPFPETWQAIAQHRVDHYRRVTSEQRQKLHGIALVLLHEKRWEGCDGLHVTPDMQVTIAVQMAVMLLGLEDYYFDRVTTVLLYPRVIRRSARRATGGLIHESVDVDGEAWHEGAVVLSWAAVAAECRSRRARRNVVIHEMAHQIDRVDGDMGGTPPFADPTLHQQWQQVASREFHTLCQAVSLGLPHVLDEYATVDRAEFFAVATEAFYRQPHVLHQHHGELFDLLGSLYRIDPRSWFDPPQDNPLP